jgi:phage gp29-like protein
MKMSILDAYGREVKAGRPIVAEVGVGTAGSMYSSYPSQGLTPERLAAILKEADQGDVLRQAELFEEMEEKDAHLGSVLQTRKLAVAGLDWEVVADPGTKGQEAAAFVKEAIGHIENWDGALLDLLDAIGKGFAISEIMWEVAGGRVWAKELRWRHQKMFTFYDGGRLVEAPRLLTGGEPVRGEELPPNKFVVHRFRSRSGAAHRAGILRPCAYTYLFKNYALKDWVIFNERFAMPMRVGKFGPGASEAERRTLRNAVFNLGSDAAAVISDSTVIELLDTDGKRASADIYEKLLQFCDRSVSKAVLGHTGSSESTPGRLGSEHEAREVRQDLIEADAKALQRTINMQLVRPLVEFNFGPDAGLPAFRFRHEAEEDLREVAETYRTISQMGVEVPAEFVYERFGIPMPEKGEEQ